MGLPQIEFRCGLMMIPLLASLGVNALQPPMTTLSRRNFFAVSSVNAATTFLPQISNAVPLLKDAEVDRMKSKMMKVSDNGSDKIQRQPLALDFAVLLTRSSYVETDQLDIIPINQLERDMYLLRTAAYEPYIQKVKGVKQGDLTDPKYFDFMSSVQYNIFNRALQDPELDFEEMQPDASQMPDGLPPKPHKVVDQLVKTYDQRVGTSILDYLRDTYRGTPIALQEASPATTESRPGVDQVHAALIQLVKLFLINGFAWEGRAKLLKDGGEGKPVSFLLSLEAPATLWSGQSLASQKTSLRNDFLSKTAKQLVVSMGYSVKSSYIKYKGDTELTYLTIQ
ncbi:expressed unknown protein [Seminavis robusta]|uniref:Uncharacterized protein n=1 Tax=Seminavis robusta TaxID=568900 RepID=A0A9N8E2N2_9STRA|nr:expressed unknown protein [Seminavis robusta]|eukprot:Sro556_g165900.1 n/a (339) ;mRNA; r:14673-15689